MFSQNSGFTIQTICVSCASIVLSTKVPSSQSDIVFSNAYTMSQIILIHSTLLALSHKPVYFPDFPFIISTQLIPIFHCNGDQNYTQCSCQGLSSVLQITITLYHYWDFLQSVALFSGYTQGLSHSSRLKQSKYVLLGSAQFYLLFHFLASSNSTKMPSKPSSYFSLSLSSPFHCEKYLCKDP